MRIDLNGNVGESFGSWTAGEDGSMLRVVTTANVACGFHAGDPTAMHGACLVAVQRRLRIGALVGYRDLHGFGERYLAIDPEDLLNEVIYQLGALDGIALSVGGKLACVRLAGALGEAVSQNPEQANAVIDAIKAYDDSLTLIVKQGSWFAHLADTSALETVVEADATTPQLVEEALVAVRSGAVGSLHLGPETMEVRQYLNEIGVTVGS
ncbi:LamB/YcsF family protein [Granulicoccus phenolivorans]|uniref:LamB/YcsF family protein n=1 Tax=Granulicoccus phenolivorans TaxID=266854 RepID=UPI00138AF664|nr:LamB/YcsF family protein [Granulicoccus phenolivorans]